MATWRAVSLVLTSSCFPAALASTSGPNSGKRSILVPQENERNQPGPAVCQSQVFQQLVQALPFLQGMASCRSFSGFNSVELAYSPHSTQIHSSFSPLRCRDLLK